MIHLRLFSSLLMVLLMFVADISQVIGKLSQNSDQIHNPTNGYNLDEGPVLYQAYYPDDEKFEQEKNLIYRAPVIKNSWQINSNTRTARASPVDSQNSDDPSTSLHQPKNNYVIEDRPNDRYFDLDQDTSEVAYKRHLGNLFNILIDTNLRKVAKPIDESLILGNLRNNDRLVSKSYIEYWKLANALANHKIYNIMSQLLSGYTDKNKQSIIDTLNKENIFQPRPQIISYKFDPSVKIHAQTDNSNYSTKIHERDNVNDETLQNDLSYFNKEPRVESITVEGKHTHKIRHRRREKMQQMF